MALRRISLGIFLIVCLASGLAGCGRLPNRPNPSDLPSIDLLDEDNCRVGCWRGLYPGVTSEQRLKAFFENDPKFPFRYSGHRDDFNWYTSEYLEAKVRNGVLSNLRLSGPFNLTLEQILDKLGEPEIIATYSGSYGDIGGFAEGQLFLHYPHSGYSFTLYYYWGTQKENGLETCLQPDDVIWQIFVFPVASVEDYIAQDQNLSENRVKILDVWPGYTCIVLRAY